LSHAAAKPVATETEGYACMGDDKSRKETEQAAINDAKRKATEYAATYIKSETHVKDAVLEKDLLSAYANAKVKVLKELEKGWYKDPLLGECYKTRMKVEVIPGAGNTAQAGAFPGTIEQEKTRIFSVNHALDFINVTVIKPPPGEVMLLINNKDVSQLLSEEQKHEAFTNYSLRGTVDELNLHAGSNKVTVKFGKTVSLDSEFRVTERQIKDAKRVEERKIEHEKYLERLKHY
jgi:hypothetical protein